MPDSILSKMYATCDGCKPVCCNDAPLVLKTEVDHVKKTFSHIIPGGNFEGKAGDLTKQKTGECAGFNCETGACRAYQLTRPIICEVHPFFPHPDGILVSTSCPYIFAKVEKLTKAQRETLKKQVMKMFAEHPRKADIAGLIKYTENWEEVHLL